MVGKPFDLDEIVQAVRRAVARMWTASMTDDERERAALWRIKRMGLTVERPNPGEWRVIGRQGATLLHTTDLETFVLFSETFGGGQLPPITKST
jgi:hypothetical protein